MKPTRVQQRQAETRARIVRAALKLFAKQGIDATTIAELSEAADIGKGTFFTYFKDKESVLTDLGDLLLELMVEDTGATLAAGEGPRARLEQLLLPGVRWHQAHPALSRLSIDVLARAGPVVETQRGSIGPLHAMMVALVEEGQAASELKADVSPQAAADVLLGLYFMSLYSWHGRGAKGSLVEAFRAGLDVILAGLSR